MFVKASLVISLLSVALGLFACSGSSEPKPRADAIVWKHGGPAVVAHRGPLPSKLVVKDLKVGGGATLVKGSTATLRYRNFDYRTGQRYEDWWERPFITGFGKGESLGAWETGLKGMRVGGRRELIVPAKEAYGHIPEIYVLELVSVH